MLARQAVLVVPKLSHEYRANILAPATSRRRNNVTSWVLTSASITDPAVSPQVLLSCGHSIPELRVGPHQESQIGGLFVEMGT